MLIFIRKQALVQYVQCVPSRDKRIRVRFVKIVLSQLNRLNLPPLETNLAISYLDWSDQTLLLILIIW